VIEASQQLARDLPIHARFAQRNAPGLPEAASLSLDFRARKFKK
jgi:hypothetical protein